MVSVAWPRSRGLCLRARTQWPSQVLQRPVGVGREFESRNASSNTRSSSRKTPVHASERPYRVAVVGSGPAGFYTTYRVMSKIPGAKVDMYETLPVPFGLVRFGVAPDHPEVKNCQEKFEEVAASPDFTFVGNVSVGEQRDHPNGNTVPLATILQHYNAVVFAYGSSQDKKLGIPGESALRGIYSAREFVGWYNGLPEHANLAPDLTQGDEAVIIGQGNVALDVARMLLEDVDVLRKSDIAEHALATLAKSRVKRVRIVGRRGPMQAAFTIKEVRELVKLPDVGFHPVEQGLIPSDLQILPRADRRRMDILRKESLIPISEGIKKSWSLDFCLSPKMFRASYPGEQQLASTIFERNVLKPSPFVPEASVYGTGESVKFPSSVAFRSIGYKSAALSEFAQFGIPFNKKLGIIKNDGRGRVAHDGDEHFSALPGLYCAGWVKRGPTGVIASTMEDAFATGDVIVEDYASNAQSLNDHQKVSGWEGVKRDAKVNKARVVSWADWQKIDSAERQRGQAIGKGREKFTSIKDMLAVLG
ncbi:hypothetical protein B0T22DRAFT_439961 [Podospora appendiculata]|uniref:NADPH:adrenodoxin oxidoreductase, mitochondrial n=1 Tax=Podospora appendiculata TaxID=314037 RepID=A0AAE0X996_9PEZI|nr:hypothetical protein B0T22DRAFT_439961 [Podospora appendiculata]